MRFVSGQAVADAADLEEAGMSAALPQSPRFVGDEFEVEVRAHTGPAEFELAGWAFFLQYDASVLALVSQTFSTLYSTPTITHDACAGAGASVGGVLRITHQGKCADGSSPQLGQAPP